MASVVTKKISGKEYLYLVASVREGHKVVQKTVKYIGKKRPLPVHEVNCMKMSYEEKDWILDKYEDTLSYQDHAKLRKASENERKRLGRLDKTSKEKDKERFLSRFIAHSNAIEGSTMTVDDTFNYLFNDVVPPGHKKKELFMASNLFDAWRYIEKNCKRLPKEEDLLELHRLVNRRIETDKTLGKYKSVQNYVGEAYTTSYLYAEERTRRLLRWIRTAFSKIDDFEVAFQSHAQFEIIHPFIDGNGRVGRLLLNWLLMYRKKTHFAIRVERRNDYISALKNSQAGKAEAICRFCLKEYTDQYRFL